MNVMVPAVDADTVVVGIVGIVDADVGGGGGGGVLERRMLVRGRERRWTPATATTVERLELLQQARQNSRS